MQGIVEARKVLAGRAALTDQSGIAIPVDLIAAQRGAEEAGRIVIVAAISGQAVALFTIADRPNQPAPEQSSNSRRLVCVRSCSPATIKPLFEAWLARWASTKSLLKFFRPTKWRASKSFKRRVMLWQWLAMGKRCRRTGQADLGLAMGTGTDAAIEAADVTLVRGDLCAAADAIRLSRKTPATIKANLFWASAYNVAAIPLAASGYPNPLIAGAAWHSRASSLFPIACAYNVSVAELVGQLEWVRLHEAGRLRISPTANRRARQRRVRADDPNRHTSCRGRVAQPASPRHEPPARRHAEYRQHRAPDPPTPPSH